MSIFQALLCGNAMMFGILVVRCVCLLKPYSKLILFQMVMPCLIVMFLVMQFRTISICNGCDPAIAGITGSEFCDQYYDSVVV
jgi:hypothetical protein